MNGWKLLLSLENIYDAYTVRSLLELANIDVQIKDEMIVAMPGTRIKKRKTIRYDLGKKNNKIGILIKNRETRKNTQNKLTKIKKTNLSQIKSTLAIFYICSEIHL